MVDVCVIGAGPSGLTAGCLLLQRGYSVRVYSKYGVMAGASRATAIWPRARKVLRAIGAEDVLAQQADKVDELRYLSDGSRIATISLQLLSAETDRYGLGISQHKTEKALLNAFEALGGDVIAGEVRQVMNDSDGVELVTELASGLEDRITASYCVVADGARSNTRTQMNVPFVEMAPPVDFRIADVTLSGLPRNAVYYAWSPNGGLALAPHDQTVHRIAFRAAAKQVDVVSSSDFTHLLTARGVTGVEVRDVLTTADFTARFRITAKFIVERVYFVGDAAHVMAPAGGQNMNAGILDAEAAVNDIDLRMRGDQRDAELYERSRRATNEQILHTAMSHAQDGAMRSEEEVAARDRRYREMDADVCQKLARATRMSQLDV